MSGYINLELIPNKIPWFKVNEPNFSYGNKVYSCITLRFNGVNNLNYYFKNIIYPNKHQIAIYYLDCEPNFTPNTIRIVSAIVPTTTPPEPTITPRPIINPILELQL